MQVSRGGYPGVSIRQPTAFTGTMGSDIAHVGISGHGLIPISSKFDLIGRFAHTFTHMSTADKFLPHRRRASRTMLAYVMNRIQPQRACPWPASSKWGMRPRRREHKRYCIYSNIRIFHEGYHPIFHKPYPASGGARPPSDRHPRETQ